jgi:hypothetical protein
LAKPDVWSCARNEATPGGTVVLNTISAPLDTMRSIGRAIIFVIEREVFFADDGSAVRRHDFAGAFIERAWPDRPQGVSPSRRSGVPEATCSLEEAQFRY